MRKASPQCALEKLEKSFLIGVIRSSVFFRLRP
jgi:hypothetical protein